MYRSEAATAAGFVQQLACSYLANGYHYYVVGEVPERKAPEEVDRKLVERYGLGSSKWVRARRKKAGLANVNYIRFRRFFVLCATAGRHDFFTAHAGQVRRIHDAPVAFGGYSIGYHRGFDGTWHVSVRIHPERYRDLKARLLDIATRRSGDQLAGEFARLHFEPYAPVRRQLLNLLRGVNRVRKVAGLEELPFSVLRLTRQIVRPFGDYEQKLEEAA